MFTVAPLKIINTIIMLVFIDVVYLLVLVWVFDKRLSNKSVNSLIAFFFIF